MFREIELPFKLTLLEALSIIAFAAIGYVVIYKLGYYSRLDIMWFMYELPPINLVFSSIIFLSLLIASSFLGYFIREQLNKIEHLKYSFHMDALLLIIFLIMIMLTMPVIWSVTSYEYVFYKYKLQYINAILLYCTMVYMFLWRFPTKQRIIDTDGKSLKQLLVSFMVILILYPYVYGTMEAEILLKSKNTLLNVVDIKDGNKLFLVHYYNDKFLLLSEGEKNLYKIVEYKDVNNIASNAK